MTKPANNLVSFEARDAITIGTVEHATMLDGVNVADFGNQILEYAKDKPDLHLLLNFENVAYMSSAGLTELLRIREFLEDSGGSVRLCNVTRDIYKVFRVTNLDGMFSLHEDEGVDSAVARYKRALSVAADEDAWARQDTGG